VACNALTACAAPCRHAADLVVHLGYDAWHQNEKLVLPLQQLPADEARNLSLPYP